MTTKEFDEKTLKQLIIDLKDIDNYKNFKHGSFIYDLGYYQGNLLVNEIDRLNNKVSELENINEKIGLALNSAENKVDRLNNIINELEKWCLSWKENDKYCYLASNDKDKCRYDIWEEVLNKLKELKENK